MRTLGLTVAPTLLPIADEEIKIFAVLHMSLFGPERQFAAAQRCVSYQRRTRRSAATAYTAAPDPELPPLSSYCTLLNKGRLNRSPNQFFDLMQVPRHVYAQCLNFFARRNEVRYHDRHHPGGRS
jgi:hypothetical protein